MIINLKFQSYYLTCTDSTKKSDADLNQSATVSLKSGCEYTKAKIIPTRIIFTMKLVACLNELKHKYIFLKENFTRGFK